MHTHKPPRQKLVSFKRWQPCTGLSGRTQNNVDNCSLNFTIPSSKKKEPLQPCPYPSLMFPMTPGKSLLITLSVYFFLTECICSEKKSYSSWHKVERTGGKIQRGKKPRDYLGLVCSFGMIKKMNRTEPPDVLSTVMWGPSSLWTFEKSTFATDKRRLCHSGLGWL